VEKLRNFSVLCYFVYTAASESYTITKDRNKIKYYSETLKQEYSMRAHNPSHISVILATAILLSTSGMSLCHASGLNVNVNIDTPPSPAPVYVAPPPPPTPVYVSPAAQVALPTTPPQFVYVPELGYYVAIDVPFDMIYVGNVYYYYTNGYWYQADYYGAQWRVVAKRALPPILARFSFKEIHRYRDREFKLYQRDRAHYRGQLHRPEVKHEERRDIRKDEHREEHGR